jgi:alcohol dehydrogenase
MQQLTFIEAGRLEWREAPDPRLRGDGEALVRPVAAAPCDIDRLTIRGEGPFRGEHAIGHQCVAEVLEIGDGVSDVRPGQLVVVPPLLSCGGCDRCREGLVSHCRTTPPRASYGFPTGGGNGGLFDEVVRVPFAEAMLQVLPSGVTPAAAVETADDLLIPIEFLGGHLRRRPGARVLVLGGGGSEGLHGVAVARALGSSRVVYLDPDEERRALAAKLGAEVDPGPPRPELGEFELIFDAAGDTELLVASLPLLAPEGNIESVGGHFGEIPLPGLRMYLQGVTFHTAIANATATHVHAAFDLILAGRIDPTAVLTETLPMEQAHEALAEPSMKPLFVRERLGTSG